MLLAIKARSKACPFAYPFILIHQISIRSLQQDTISHLLSPVVINHVLMFQLHQPNCLAFISGLSGTPNGPACAGKFEACVRNDVGPVSSYSHARHSVWEYRAS